MPLTSDEYTIVVYPGNGQSASKTQRKVSEDRDNIDSVIGLEHWISLKYQAS
jgi:hypothetical protein